MEELTSIRTRVIEVEPTGHPEVVVLRTVSRLCTTSIDPAEFAFRFPFHLDEWQSRGEVPQWPPMVGDLITFRGGVTSIRRGV